LNSGRCRESDSDTPGEGMETLCSFPHTLPYTSLPSGYLSVCFYNKLVNMTPGGAEMLSGTKLPGRLTTNGRDTTSMEKGEKQTSHQAP